LNYEGIISHPFFKTVKWEELRHSKPPIVPIVEHELDTQNFDSFEEDTDAPTAEEMKVPKSSEFFAKRLLDLRRCKRL
jgi:hypothetical protein